MKRLLFFSGLSNVALGGKSSLKLAFVTDNHIGESCNGDLSYEGCRPVRALTDAVSKINELGVDGVFATGDLTGSALYEEFEKFRKIMNDLTVPWWPLLGNHDSWPYTRHSDGTFNQTDTPIGDMYFAEIFGDILQTATEAWPTAPCPNQDFDISSWFHNFEVNFPSFSKYFKVLALDWVARGNALPEPGVGPEVELHDFVCGTVDWLSQRLAAADKDTKFFIAQHHPFHNRDALDPFGQNILFNFTFDARQDARVQEVLGAHFPVSSFLGVHAGHMHRWYNGSAFTSYTASDENWLNLRQFETPASKGWWLNEEFLGSFQVFHFSAPSTESADIKLDEVAGYWKLPSGEWSIKPGVGNTRSPVL
jgi:hypothetical protein